jgi:hypothetical protein
MAVVQGEYTFLWKHNSNIEVSMHKWLNGGIDIDESKIFNPNEGHAEHSFAVRLNNVRVVMYIISMLSINSTHKGL